MNQTVLGLILILAIGVTFFLGFRKKVPVGIIMIIAAIVITVMAGFGLPLRQFFEGSFYFLYLILQIITGMLLIKTMEATGALEAMTHTICAATARFPSLLLAILAVFVMFPAMLTGSTPVAVLTTGVLVSYTLLRIGVPKLETAAIVGMAALCGQSAPPVNVMIMIICTSTFMPYEGFALPLALTTFPLAIFSALYLGRKHVQSEALLEMAQEDREAGNLVTGPQFIKLSLPLIVLVLFMIIPRMFPFVIPDPNTPFMFIVCTFIALFTGVKRSNILAVSRDTVEHGMTVLTLFIGMGVLVHAMSLTGVKGFLATTVVALPKAGLYLSTLIGPPLLGGPVVPFGVSAIIGPPLVLAFAYKNSIIATTAISLLLSLGCLFPPTALSSLFAARAVGIDNYMTVTRRCLVPALVMATVAMLVLVFADEIARLIMPSGGTGY